MQEIANQADIEEDALIQYIIDGVPDDEANKTILYKSRTIRELKGNFEIYDRMREKIQRKKTGAKKTNVKNDAKETKNTHSTKSNSKPSEKRHCFHCGSTEHEVKNCTNADKGPKCFKCNNFGHIATKCPQGQQMESTTSGVNWVTSADDNCIPVNVAGLKYSALLDTGSDVNLMRKDVYEGIGQPKMNTTMRTLTGFGNTSIKPDGVLQLELSVDGGLYKVDVFVVPTYAMVPDLILGRDFLRHARVVILDGKTEIEPRNIGGTVIQDQKQQMQDDQSNFAGYKEIAAINCIAADELDVAESYRSRIETLIAGHHPNKDVQTTIIDNYYNYYRCALIVRTNAV